MARAEPRALDAGYKSKRECGWKQQEKRVARKLGCKQQPGSGSKDFAKGDLKGKELLVECKSTDKQSIRVEAAWLEKISKEAMAVGKIPALSIELRGTEVSPVVPRDWVMLPAEVIRLLLGDG